MSVGWGRGMCVLPMVRSKCRPMMEYQARGQQGQQELGLSELQTWAHAGFTGSSGCPDVLASPSKILTSFNCLTELRALNIV